MVDALIIGTGRAIGAVLRYLLSLWTEKTAFPGEHSSSTSQARSCWVYSRDGYPDRLM